ncbi:hypothetical protein LCGC14_0780160 [marine sediment metagenome]|uniref:Proliferating cell nuclear antigen PCNA N-terminal domain-containing protein n=1 Tax=marine sediment metagenome TaxID=412755 RepID=A0A0F9SFR1_9ZZZZ
MTKKEYVDKMKGYWERILHQSKTNKSYSSLNKPEQKPVQSNDTNFLAELYIKNYFELVSIFKKLSKFTDTFRFNIRKNFIIVNCITQSRILLTYLKLRTSSYKFHKGGKLYINGKQITDEINQNTFKNLPVRLFFTENSLIIVSANHQKIYIYTKISNEDYLNEILVEGFEKLNYTNKIKLHKKQLENIILDQEQHSDVFKIGFFNGSISFKNNQEYDYLGFSLKDIKRVLKILTRNCKYLELSVDKRKPMKIQADLKLLGNSIIFFYFSQHI